MKKILVINGPNLNMLGKRDPRQYGTLTLKEIEDMLKARAQEQSVELKFYQSNHEGALIDFIQQHTSSAAAIIINPGALTHYSYALLDALLDATLPAVEVHLSDIASREDFRKVSVTQSACLKQFMGRQEQSYLDALEFLVKYFNDYKH